MSYANLYEHKKQEESKIQECNIAKTNIEEVSKNQEEWKIIIPKLGIAGNIKEGTQQEVLVDYVGHFTQTPQWEGNIGLIANNSGGNVNYFENLEHLVEKDVILYQYQGKQKEYEVTQNKIIQDTDWSYLSSTEQNQLTLITGAKTQENERRCVQAIEITK